MFTKIALLYVLSFFSILAVASPGRRGLPTPTHTVTVTSATTTTTTCTAVATTMPISQCNTGGAQCCNTVEAANSGSPVTIAGLPLPIEISVLLGLLDIVLQDVTALVGLGCTPIDILAIGGPTCSQQPVCCQDNDFSGLINVGCVPITL